MIREDFVLRMIRQIVLIVAGSRRQRQEARLQDALDTLDDGSRSLFGLDTGLLVTLPDALLGEVLAPDGDVDEGRALAMALLLEERAAILDLLDQPDAAAATRSRQQRLLLHVGRPDLDAWLAEVDAAMGDDGA